MKELSIEEKARAYDEVLNKLRHFLTKGVDPLITRADVQDFFPELAESEDEKIRKELIKHLKELSDWKEDEVIPVKNPSYYRQWATWLERQAEHANFLSKIQVGDKVTRNENGVLVNLSQLKRVAKPSERQGEQKFEMKTAEESLGIDSDTYNKIVDECIFGEQKPADKVEPKFKVGDWCIDNEDGVIFQIVKVLDNTYTYKTNEGKKYSCSHYSLENDVHLWTIQDAKDGDVLYINNTLSESIMIYKSFNNGVINKYASYNKFGFECENYLTLNDGYIIPATKEQRDTLMKAMADAGYTFDFEKKKLKNIVQKSEENKGNIGGISSNWSEEDEVKINRIVACLKNLNVADNDILLKDVDWLKSLKGRVQPKQEWNEEDEQHIDSLLKRLDALCRNKFERTRFAISEDKDWLKSLKQRIQKGE